MLIHLAASSEVYSQKETQTSCVVLSSNKGKKKISNWRQVFFFKVCLRIYLHDTAKKWKQPTAAVLEAVADRGQVGAGIPSGGGGGRSQRAQIQTYCRCKVIWICGYLQQPQGKSPEAVPSLRRPLKKHLSWTSSSGAGWGATVNKVTQLAHFGRRRTEIVVVVRPPLANFMCLKSSTTEGTDGSWMSLWAPN